MSDTSNTAQNKIHQLQIGTMLANRYRVGTAIGQGGFGITYEGYDVLVNTKVAIKEYYPSGFAHRSATESSIVSMIDRDNIDFVKSGMDKFLGEAKVLAKCSENRGVVNVRDYFEENSTAYIVMEFLEGTDLKHKIKDNLFSPSEIISLLDPVFLALEQIHANGIIHRDISPDNLMLLEDGTIKLMDFGAARLANYDDMRSVSIVLKAGYAPGEQYRKRGKQGPWTDIYALCATIYKCITGITPDDALEREHADILKKPSELGVSIDENTEHVLMIGLSIDPRKRFQSIPDFRSALNGELDLSVYDEPSDDDDSTVLYENTMVGMHTYDGGYGTDSADGNLDSKGISLKNKKYVFGAAIIALVTVAVFVVSFLWITRKNASDTANADLETDAANESSETVDTDESITDATDSVTADDTVSSKLGDVYEIVMMPNDALTIEGFTTACKIIEERVQEICPDGDYEFNVDGQQINISIPQSKVLDISDLNNLTRWYLANGNDFEIVYDADSGDGTDYVSDNILAEDIVNAQIKYGQIPNTDNDDLTYREVEGEYPYLELELTDSFWEKYKDVMFTEENECSFRLFDQHDRGNYSWNEYYFHYVDEKKIAIFNDRSEFRYKLGYEPWELYLLKHNLCSPNIDMSFSTDIKWNTIDWYTSDTPYVYGKNECLFEELPDKYVIAKFSFAGKADDITEGAMYSTIETLTERLDTLDVSYALGHNQEYHLVDLYDFLYIALPLNHLNDYVMNMVTTYHTSGSVEAGKYYLSNERKTISFPDYNGSKCMVITYSDYYADTLRIATEYLINQGVDRIYFEFANDYLCSMPLTEPITDGIFAFTDLTHKSKEGDDTWQWNLIESVVNQGYEKSLFFEDSQYVNNIDNTAFAYSDYGVSEVFDMDAFNTELKGIVSNGYAEHRRSETHGIFESSERNTIDVELNLSVDENFADNSMNAVDEILDMIHFSEVPYLADVMIYFTKEDEITNEYARFEIEKGFHTYIDLFVLQECKSEEEIDDYFDSLEIENNSIECWVGNGRMEQYHDDFIDKYKEIKAKYE